MIFPHPGAVDRLFLALVSAALRQPRRPPPNAGEVATFDRSGQEDQTESHDDRQTDAELDLIRLRVELAKRHAELLYFTGESQS